MDIKRRIKFLGFCYASAAVSFPALLLMSILLLSSAILLLPIQSANADSYNDGYNEGCYDAGRDLRGLNGHSYDESVNHGDSQFQAGYVNGYRACWNIAIGNYQSPLPPQNTYPEPGGSNNDNNNGIRINWGQVCRNPIVDVLITEPCYTLTTPDGYTLTAEGERVVRCIAAGTALLLYDPTGTTLAAARQLGPAVGCR